MPYARDSLRQSDSLNRGNLIVSDRNNPKDSIKITPISLDSIEPINVRIRDRDSIFQIDEINSSPIDSSEIDTEIDVLMNRNVVYSRKVVIQSKEITIKIWDEGKNDKDTVSFFLNEEALISSYRLTKKKKEITFNIDSEIENVIVLYAHNLGKIPPNTAATIIYDGVKTQQLKMRSNLLMSDGIRLVYSPSD